MSALFGLVRRDGRDGRVSDAERLRHALRHRGPDGEEVLVKGPAVLGHQLLAVSSNGALDDGDLAITFDGRIDNRAELSALLALGSGIRDDALVLAAYRKWGKGCARHLIGDFAFAIWDGGAGQLVCARDQIGVRPFYYHDGARAFLFGSEPQALLAEMPELAYEIDEAWLADFAAGYFPPPEACLYPGIRRLLPGYVAVADRHGLSLERYYTLALTGPVAPADAAAQFAAIFETAVACRLDSRRPAAALLSGGLDSSSVVAVAAPLLERRGAAPLPTLSMIFPETPEDDESAYVEAVAASSRIAPTLLASDRIPPFQDFDALLAQQGAPFIAPNLATSGRLHGISAEHGFGVLLDGHGGDEALAYGTQWLVDLAFTGRWLRLWREIRDLGKVEGVSALRPYLSLLLTRGPHRRLVVAAKRRWRRTRPSPPGRHRYVEPSLAARTGLAERRPVAPVDPTLFGREERHSHLAGLVFEAQPYALELLDRSAAAAGVELRFPLLDLRVLEFCLSLPSSEKLRHGLTRSLIRRALADKLPEAVRKRPGKLDFTPHLIRGMIECDAALIDDVLADEHGTLGNYFNIGLIRSLWSDLRGGRKTPSGGLDVQAIWRAVALGLWLRQRSEQRKQIR